MRYQVKLRYFQSDAYDGWGFAHADTFNHENPFDPFYDASGLFHDVFEHYFEGTGRFIGEKQNSLYGEMVATGHKYYYYHELGINSFEYRDFGNYITDWAIDTKYDVQGNIDQELGKEDADYSQYALTPLHLPYQRPLDCRIEHEIKVYQEYIRDKCGVSSRHQSMQEIANAYRYGYRMAERKWPNEGVWETAPKQNMMRDFLQFWQKFTKNYSAANLMIIDEDGEDYGEYGLRSLIFTVDTRKATWKVKVEDDARQFHNINKLRSFY